jgi:hypothetical protein
MERVSKAELNIIFRQTRKGRPPPDFKHWDRENRGGTTVAHINERP